MALGAEASYYFPAWIGSLLVAVLALMLLSIPRHVRVTPGGIELMCLVEMTVIPTEKIEGIEQLEKLPLRGAVPVAAMFGFGGYCGYWLSLREFSLFKVYATDRGRCLRIRRRDGLCDIVVGGVAIDITAYKTNDEEETVI